jgi:hypothetical protein
MDSFFSSVAELVRDFWPHLVAGAVVLVSVAAAVHAVLNKRDSRAAIGWVGVIWLSPPLGALLYYLFGINRIQRRAKLLRGGQNPSVLAPTSHAATEAMFREKLGDRAPLFAPFVSLVGKLAEHPLLYGNRVQPLCSGDEAYPQMLSAIDDAQGCAGARADRQRRFALYVSHDRAVPPSPRRADRSVYADLGTHEFQVHQLAQPPQNSRGRRSDRFYGRAEYPRRGACQPQAAFALGRYAFSIRRARRRSVSRSVC